MQNLKTLPVRLLTLALLASLALMMAAYSGCGSKKNDAAAEGTGGMESAGGTGDTEGTASTDSAGNGTSNDAGNAQAGDAGGSSQSQDGGTGDTAGDTAGDDTSNGGQGGDAVVTPSGDISDLQRNLLGHWTNGTGHIYISETAIIFVMGDGDQPSSESTYVVTSVLDDENILVISESGTTEYVKFKDDRRAFNIYPEYDLAAKDLSETAFEYVDDRTGP